MNAHSEQKWGLEGWYIPIESGYIAHVNALEYISSFALVIVSVFYGQDRKSQFPLDILTTEMYYCHCLQIKHISNPLCSTLRMARVVSRMNALLM